MGQSATYSPERAMNGTFGYVYIDGEEVIELDKVTIKDTISYESINQPGELRAGQKMMGLEGSGEFTINRINHKLMKRFAASIDSGKQPTITITTIIADPNASEAQTMAFYDCTIEELPYIAFEPKSIVKDSFPFHYRERKFID